MLYILTALKCEASVLNGLPGKVIVTGTGPKAYVAVEELELTPSDKVLNVGICAGDDKGRGYLINQVIMEDTGRRYYPDILFATDAEERTLTTSSSIVSKVEEGMLYDMEAAFILDKALRLIPPSSVAVYKVVSDNGTDLPTPKEVTELIRSCLPEIKKIASRLVENISGGEYSFLPEDIYQKLRLTQYMRNELKDLEHYCAVAGRKDELTGLMKKMEDNGRIPVKDKKAGREVLDEIYSCLR